MLPVRDDFKQEWTYREAVGGNFLIPQGEKL
jgi:hypothetical protein